MYIVDEIEREALDHDRGLDNTYYVFHNVQHLYNVFHVIYYMLRNM